MSSMPGEGVQEAAGTAKVGTGKSLNPSGPQFPHLFSGDNNIWPKFLTGGAETGSLICILSFDLSGLT